MMAQKGKTKISRVISPTKIPKQKNNGETVILSGHAGVNNPLEKSLRSSYGTWLTGLIIQHVKGHTGP